ncbi:MAG: T9SS type A sorting domain-containing protein [Chitinophagales bacterium]|nr:T9SS type A sorting domain-containing protein [Bacteroidota bacterium]MBK8487327.1 T9SS type A sorting domain-containing protein [Bacteroidota bacterium]MBK8682934.1 T9SS type A sorting domain-containing protein [Bacteroidota bacterium]
MNSIVWGQCTTVGSGICTAAADVGSATWSGYYCVNSDITVSGALVITSGSTLEFSGFYKITVVAGASLNITNTDIYGLTTLWDRITVEPGGYLDLTDSRIQDGTKAVFAQNGISESFLNLTGNIFCNNETGIYLNSITTSTLLTTNIANNEIYAPSLKGSGTKGDFGIYINEVKNSSSGAYAVRIGTPLPYTGSSSYNYIHDVNIGIRSYRSSPLIQNNLITNILGGSPTTLPSLDAPYANTAIAASSNSSDLVSIQIGLMAIPSVYNNEIRNSTTGISCNQYVNTIITGNNIFGNVVSGSYSMTRGIFLYDNINTATINGNRIEKYSNEGVFFDNLLLQGIKTVSDNKIGTVSGFTSVMNPHGVRVRELVLSSSYILNISGNTIDKVRTGIFTNNINHPTISGNIVNFQSTGGSSTSCGIRSIECPTVQISSNTVIGDCFSGFCGGNVRPIMVEGCGDFVLNENYVQYGSAGIWIQDNSVLGNLYCNQIRDSYKGVMLYNIGGPLPSPLGPVEGLGGFASDNAWYSASIQNRLHTFGTTDASNVKWRHRIIPSFDKYDPTVLNTGGGPYPSYVTATNYCDLPDMKMTDEEEGYLINRYGDWMIEYISDDASYSSTSYYYSWQFWNDIQNDTSVIESLSDDLLEAYNKISETNIPLFYEVLTAISENNKVYAFELNNTIVSENEIEENWQITNGIYLNSLDDEGIFNLSDDNAAILHNMVSLNPQEYGFGVYNAWSMLDTVVNYNLDWTEEKLVLDNLEQLHFYPNPTTNTITFSTALNSGDLILISSLDGRMIKQFKIQNEMNIIDVSSLITGMYIITVLDDNSIKLTDKLFIIK